MRTLDDHLEGFLDAHPGGWDHHAWRRLLHALESDGHEVADPDRLGSELERIRLVRVLEELGVAGLGPKRRAAVVEAFGRLWDLRQADAETLAAMPALPRDVAARLYDALH